MNLALILGTVARSEGCWCELCSGRGQLLSSSCHEAQRAARSCGGDGNPKQPLSNPHPAGGFTEFLPAVTWLGSEPCFHGFEVGFWGARLLKIQECPIPPGVVAAGAGMLLEHPECCWVSGLLWEMFVPKAWWPPEIEGSIKGTHPILALPWSTWWGRTCSSNSNI